jgi:hypothetical protein
MVVLGFHSLVIGAARGSVGAEKWRRRLRGSCIWLTSDEDAVLRPNRRRAVVLVSMGSMAWQHSSGSPAMG